MPSTTKLALFLLLLACLCGLGASISCHNCQYDTCGDYYDVDKFADNLGDCDDDQYCVKYKTIVWIQDSGEIKGSPRESHVVTRTCESKKGKKEGCTGWQNNGGVTLKCWCGTDGCNSGNSMRPMVVIPIAIATLVGFLSKALSL